MNFTLTEERQMLQDGLRRYLRDTVTPELLEDATESVSGHSETLWQGLARPPGASGMQILKLSNFQTLVGGRV